MTQIGTIEYRAKVTGAGEARAQMGELDDSFASTATSAESAGAASGFLAGSMSASADATEDASDEAENADASFTILDGTLLGLIGTVGSFALELVGLGGVSSTVSGIIGTIAGGASAATAGIIGLSTAAGVAVGAFGIWILQTLGVFDALQGLGQFVGSVLPGWVKDGVLQILSFFAPLLAVGVFIEGTLEGGFRRGFAKARRLTQTFVGAWERQIDRAIRIGKGIGQWARNQLPTNVRQGIIAAMGFIMPEVAKAAAFIQGTIEGGFAEGFRRARAVEDKFVSTQRRTFDRMESFITGKINAIESTYERVLGGLIDKFEQVQSMASDLPTDPLSAASQVGNAATGGGFGFGGFNFGGGSGFNIGLPQLASGGTIAETGAAVVHKGETVVPPGGGGDVNVDTITIRIDGGDFDPSDLSRSQIREMAERLVDAIGDKTNRRSGVR